MFSSKWRDKLVRAATVSGILILDDRGGDGGLLVRVDYEHYQSVELYVKDGSEAAELVEELL